jgi:hypothetical protein
VHVEVFAANHVVIIPAGIGTRPPRTTSDARIITAACYGNVITLDPTGVVLVRHGTAATLATLFHSWGQPLSTTQLASFRAQPDAHVLAFIDGSRWHGPPGDIPLRRHSEVVVEVGPYVPPHRQFAFAPGT